MLEYNFWDYCRENINDHIIWPSEITNLLYIVFVNLVLIKNNEYNRANSFLEHEVSYDCRGAMMRHSDKAKFNTWVYSKHFFFLFFGLQVYLMLGFTFNSKIALLSLFLVSSYNGFIESMQSINDKVLYTYIHIKAQTALKGARQFLMLIHYFIINRWVLTYIYQTWILGMKVLNFREEKGCSLEERWEENSIQKYN